MVTVVVIFEKRYWFLTERRVGVDDFVELSS